MTTSCKKRWEIATTGFDEYLSLIGGDPDGGNASVGLRVPTLATPAGRAGLTSRYQFNLASFSIGEGVCARIIGYRQLLTLGYAQPYGEGTAAGLRVVEQEVESASFRLPDGNVSWHLRTIGGPNAQQQQQQPNPGGARGATCDSFAYQWSDTPACLFGTGQVAPPGRIYTNLTSYVAPNSGKLPGQGIAAGLGTFYDLRTQWRTHGGWQSLDILVPGPDTIAFIATVRQSNPSTRPALVVPAAGQNTFYPGGLSAEEQFLKNYPGAIFWRIGGALIVEEA